MRRSLTSLCLSALLLVGLAPAALPYTQQFTSSSQPIRWAANTVTVYLAASVNAPPPNIKAGSDVEGAVRRALRRWSDAANINFDVRTNGPDAVGTSNDGFNVISVSAANSSFVPAANPGRTRVSSDPATGAIAEADVAINPNQPFSTDGTHGTYDLESTLVHEIGHFIGLDHCGLVGSSMQPRQAQNFSSGGFDLTQTTVRTLSGDDVAAARAIYGQRAGRAVGSIQGSLNYPFAGANVRAENADTGRVVASAVTRSDGSYRIDQVPPGDYRVIAEYLDEPVVAQEITGRRGPYANIGDGPAFQSAATTASVAAGATAFAPIVVLLVPPTLNLRRQGLNGIIHAGPMPVAPGNTYRYYVAGEGVDLIAPTEFHVDSPFFSIDPATYRREDNAAFGLPYPLVSFDLRVLDNAKFGDFSLRVRRSDTGETAYFAAGLAVDPYTDFAEINPIDNNFFFVRQQYRDFLFREPESSEPWTAVLNGCPDPFNLDPNSASSNCDRISLSYKFFSSQEFQLKGFFIYRFYKAAFARQPAYEEITPDMQFVTAASTAELNQRRDAFTSAFAARAEFHRLYDAMSNDSYVNALMDRYSLPSILTPNPVSPNGQTKVVLSRAELINRLTVGTMTRAQVLRAVADSDEVGQAESNAAFVSMQYFGYLRRGAESGGFAAWLNHLNTHPGDVRSMVNGFVNSSEYRSRFGHL
ncbi:MAG TPA: matrixin family metalloprotease [Pyrinomonadaceae bacterium]